MFNELIKWLEEQLDEAGRHYMSGDDEESKIHNDKIDMIVHSYIHVLCHIDPEYNIEEK